MSHELTVIAADGVRLHAQCHGVRTDAIPVMCLPGLTRNSRDFAALADRLGAERAVVTFDFRGRGRSDPDPTGAGYAPDTYAADAVAVLDAAGLGRACLVGTSLGGSVAALVAVLHPERVAGVVLNDVGPVLEPDGVRRIQGYAGKVPPAASWDEMAATLSSLHGSTAPDLDSHDWRAIAEQQCRRFDDGLVRPDHDPAIVAGFDAIDPTALPDTWAIFANLGDLPGVVLRGELSDLLSEATVAEMLRRCPGLSAVTVVGRGHAPTLAEPEARAAIEALLARLDER